MFPEELLHPSQWPGYAFKRPEFKAIDGLEKEFYKQLDKYNDDAKEQTQYMKNMGRYFLDAKETLQCPLCLKWT